LERRTITSEEHQVRFEAPHSPNPTRDERELLLGFIRWQREQVVATMAGLSDDQVWWKPGDALLPLGGIVNHLTHMEWRWVEGRYGGTAFPPRTDEFVRSPELTASALIDAYAAQVERTERIVRAATDLDAPCFGDEGGRGPAHELLGLDTPVTLRWVLIHLVEETAHHAGHADSTREMLDGRKMRA
jgi:uncharacterized damage-inducible protein DinB